DAHAGTHMLPLGMKPVLHMMPQVPPVHVAVPLVGAGHALPQVPQFAVSIVVSTQFAPHIIRGALQPARHMPPVQLEPVAHAFPVGPGLRLRVAVPPRCAPNTPRGAAPVAVSGRRVSPPPPVSIPPPVSPTVASVPPSVRGVGPHAAASRAARPTPNQLRVVA